ncbi:MAG: polysaccharide biosynthesis C-terminal domain-containing protein [Bacteroidetes bacterium]|nr:polysaccharide biosynthesis C-terminal domain-containing protein [Bacteroidota bacterium]
MGVLKKLAGQTAIYGISSILGRVLNLALTPLYTNEAYSGFGEGAYGIMSSLYSFIALMNIILIFGMETTFFRFSQDDKDFKTVYNQAYIWIILMSVSFLTLGGLLYQPIAAGLGYPDQSLLVLLTVGILFFDTLAALPMARMRYEEKAMRFAIINLINIVVTVVLNFIFILGLRLGIEFIFVANLIASFIRLVMGSWGNLPTSIKPDKDLIKQMVSYGFYIMVAGLAGMMTQTLDRILIPILWEDGTIFHGIERTGEEINGLYAAIYKIVIFIALATQAFRYAVEPFFFKESKNDNSPETFARVFHYFVLASLTGFLFIASFSKEIVSFNLWGLLNFTFIGKAYWEALEVVPILLLAYVFNGAYVNLSIWFKITKQVRYAILFTGVGAVLTLFINYFTIPVYGYIGSAWATLICFASMCVLVYLVGQKYYPVPYRIKRMGLYLLIFLVAYFINYQVGPTEGYYPAFLFKLVITLGALGGIYVIEKYWPIYWVKGK